MYLVCVTVCVCVCRCWQWGWLWDCAAALVKRIPTRLSERGTLIETLYYTIMKICH